MPTMSRVYAALARFRDTQPGLRNLHSSPVPIPLRPGFVRQCFVRRRAALILAVVFALAVDAARVCAQLLPIRDVRSFSVTHYDVQLAPRLESRTVTGVATRSVVLHRDQVDTIALARGRLEIDSVQEDGSARPFVVDGSRVRITLPRGRANQTRTLTIAYHGMPSSGLMFDPEREQFYTVFSTSQWMVAVDEPDARATLRLRLTIPRGWLSAASGREISRRDTSPSEAVVEWQLDRPVPTYTFGFVAGAFSEASDRASGVSLRYLGRGVSALELQQVFKESARMIAFFEERSGVTYPSAVYTQVLVARTAGQEMAGVSIFSEDYGRAVLADSSAIARRRTIGRSCIRRADTSSTRCAS
jgi:aminopeptidase N